MYKAMNINDIDAMINDVEIIDVRTKEEFDMGHLKNAKNIEMMGLMFNHAQFLDKSKTYYIYCQSGGRSATVASALASNGYDIIDMGGYMSYNNK